MNRYIALLKKILKEDMKVLGRWRITYCDKQIDSKMMWASQDYTSQTQEKTYDIDTQIRYRYMV